MEGLGINGVSLIAQIVNFGIILFVLKKFVYKPLLNMLDKRKQMVADNVKKAEEIKKEEVQIETLKTETTKKSKAEAKRLEAETLKEAREKAKEIVKTAEKQADGVKEGARKSAENTERQIKIKMEDEVLEKATILANKALQELLDKDTRVKLTRKQLEKI